MESEVLNYFETQAKRGDWESLYNPQNPKSYPFIIRLQKTLNLLEDIDNKKICDLGCGTGVLIPFILKKNGNYTGIDFSKRMLDTIRSKYQKEINDKKVDLLLSDFKNLDQTRKYDILIGLGFMEYFDEPKKIVKKLYNIISNEGRIILSFPNANSFDFLTIRLLTILRIIIKKFLKLGQNNPPRKMWSKKSAQKMLMEQGFINFKLENYYINLFVYPLTVFFPNFSTFMAKKLENTWLSKIDFFANGFIISAQKKI